ncbi:MAG TPA: phosphatidylglycerophosphatase A [Pyrinomonadaceae bacterium]|nr:phosphatidylglycerophosphatase A [Pyrinomonadaceae bacterium]
MTRVKETSDSLSHPVVETPHITVAPSRRTLGDYAALAVATCGVGLIPLAPGTWGSAVGVGLYMLMRAGSESVFAAAASAGWGVPPLAAFRTTFALLVIIAVTLAGTWAATRTEKLLGKKDPGAVVVDEVAGQLITFLFVPWDAGAWAIMAGFVAFRVFDIWKPYPIGRLERLEAGLGVMADDVLAGAYAATVMSLATSIYLAL